MSNITFRNRKCAKLLSVIIKCQTQEFGFQTLMCNVGNSNSLAPVCAKIAKCSSCYKYCIRALRVDILRSRVMVVCFPAHYYRRPNDRASQYMSTYTLFQGPQSP